MKKLDKIPPYNQIKQGEEFELNHFRGRATHSFFKYPARFIPEIPNWAIRNFTQENHSVLDCFAGSGTSLVEASIEGRKPYAIDSDPLSNLLCKVKTRHITSKEKDDLFVIVGKILSNDIDFKSLKNKDELVSAYGNPSMIDPIQKKYYYYSEKKIITNFFNQKIDERTMIVFTLDKNENVSDSMKYDIDDYRNIDIFNKTTENTEKLKKMLIEKLP